MQLNKYQRFVDKMNIEKIEDTQNDRLFKISIPLNFNGDKSALIITRAVKIYEADGSSALVYKILNYIKSRKNNEFANVNRVDIVFLFPVKEYDESSLIETFASTSEKYFSGNDGVYDENGTKIINDEVIFSSMIEADVVVLGWGNIPKVFRSVANERIRYLLKGYKVIKNNSLEIKQTYTVGELNNNGCPRHCLRWKESDELVKFDI